MPTDLEPKQVHPVSVPPVEIHDLTVAYHARPVLWDIDLTVPEGKLVAVVGPNGAGKTTLLKALIGLVPWASGWVRLFGEPPDRVRGRVAYIPQRASVDWDFPATVLDVVLMGTYGRLGWIRRPGCTEKAQALSCLEQVGMAAFTRRQIGQLSGGQQQRVFMARALVQQADLYLLDEPLAGVDAATEQTILDLLRSLRDQGKTILVVHHDLQTVAGNFDWVVVLNLRLLAAGPVEQALTPQVLRQAYGGHLVILDHAAHVRLRREQGQE
ncbi:MAG: manganese ABC transporter ATP-binding protein [Gemmataceae bacterium]